jgi:hypothetical protein
MSLSVHTLPSGKKVVVENLVTDKNGRMVGGTIVSSKGSTPPQKQGETLGSRIGFGGYKNGGLIRKGTFKGTF